MIVGVKIQIYGSSPAPSKEMILYLSLVAATKATAEAIRSKNDEQRSIFLSAQEQMAVRLGAASKLPEKLETEEPFTC